MSAELHAHDASLERAIIYAFHVWPWQHDSAFALFPHEAFYLERHRVMWRAMTAAHRDVGEYAPGTIIQRLRDANQPEAASAYADIATGASVQHDVWPACHVDLAIDAMLAMYQRRQRASAVREYEHRIAQGTDESEARLLLDMHLDGIETMRASAAEPDAEDIAAALTEGGARETGFKAIDDLCGGLASPGLNILAARASVGKSALARGIIRHRARAGDRIYWYSHDQSASQVYALEIMRLTGMTPDRLKSVQRSRLTELVQRVRSDVWHDRVVLLDRPTPLGQLVSFVRAHRPDLLVIDYLQLIDAGHEKEYDNVTAVSKALKTLAFQLRAPVLALAQFNRAAEKGDGPGLADLRASGQIEQDADMVWSLTRDTTLSSADPQPGQLTVLKNKVGPTGRVRMVWVPTRASFEVAARPQHQGAVS